MHRLLAVPAIALLGLISSASAVELSRNHLTANQWVRSTAEGDLVGRVVLPTENGSAEAVANASVAITNAAGKTVITRTDEEGQFTVGDVKPGVYALTARGKDVFACCAMHIVANDEKKAADYPAEAEISVANVDYTLVKTAVIRYLPPSAGPKQATIDNVDLEKLAAQVNGEDYSRVAQVNGGMVGQIHMAGADGGSLNDAGTTNVFVLRNGTEVARTVTDTEGKFEFAKLSPGEYSLLAVGPAGMGLTGFELIDEDAITKTAMTNAKGETLVALQGNNCCCCPQFAIQCAPLPQVVSCVEEVIVHEEVVQAAPVETIISDEVISEEIIGEEIVMDGFGTPMAGGGFAAPAGSYGGGFSGGGGGGFGGGGFGGIAALAGIGGLIAATTGDDDSNFVQAVTPPAVSGATP